MSTTTTQPSGSSWTEKKINIQIQLGTGAFGQTGFNTVKLSGLRTVVTALKAGSPSLDSAEIRIYGVQPSIINQISTLGVPLPMTRANNIATIEAGDAVNGMSILFSGNITNAWADYEEAPETSLNIVCNTGGLAAIKPVAPSSFRGTTDVATIMSGLATQMGFSFENNGVQEKLSNPYFAGTALRQAHDVARAAGIEMYVDSGTQNGTLAIWPRTGTRGGQTPLINAASGLIEYPKYRDQGMSFRTLFNPNIRVGGQIIMQSTVGGAAPKANANTTTGSVGTPTINPDGSATIPITTTATPVQQQGGPNGGWMVVSPLTYSLSSELPGGPWFCDVNCARTKVPGA
jgi:hypothetical protein